ncbi:MAG: survival motor neuron interacting protein 1-domain-containing protein [Monoraphidium minutum]|nr:MAG: survival motor neuron interacting protein 1-domain-containing protein [Monoraphidium minutum]
MDAAVVEAPRPPAGGAAGDEDGCVESSAAAAAAAAIAAALRPGGPGEEEEEDEDGGAEGSEEDVEYDLKQFGIYQALPVEGEPDWSSDVVDAEEYIRRVRHEAARCPRVVRADIDVDALAAQQERRMEERRQHKLRGQAAGGGGGGGGGADGSGGGGSGGRHHPLSAAGGPLLEGGSAGLAAAPGWAVPSGAWVRQLVADFQALRRQVAEAYESGELASERRLPGPNDAQGWDRLCFGRGTGGEDGGGDGGGGGGGAGEGEEAVPGSEITFLSPAIVPTLMALDQVGVAALFSRHAQQLLDGSPPRLPLARAQWLFALAARLDKPLTPELAAALRGLLRHCAALRGRVEAAEDPLLARLNVLIAVAGAYFGQDESMVAVIDSSELY